MMLEPSAPGIAYTGNLSWDHVDPPSFNVQAVEASGGGVPVPLSIR